MYTVWVCVCVSETFKEKDRERERERGKELKRVFSYVYNGVYVDE